MFDFQFLWNSVMNWIKSLKLSFTHAYSYIKYFLANQVANESLLTLGEVLVNTSWYISELTIHLIHFSRLSIVAVIVYSCSDYIQDLKIILLKSKWIVFYMYTTFSSHMELFSVGMLNAFNYQMAWLGRDLWRPSSFNLSAVDRVANSLGHAAKGLIQSGLSCL